MKENIYKRCVFVCPFTHSYSARHFRRINMCDVLCYSPFCLLSIFGGRSSRTHRVHMPIFRQRMCHGIFGCLCAHTQTHIHPFRRAQTRDVYKGITPLCWPGTKKMREREEVYVYVYIKEISSKTPDVLCSGFKHIRGAPKCQSRKEETFFCCCFVCAKCESCTMCRVSEVQAIHPFQTKYKPRVAAKKKQQHW